MTPEELRFGSLLADAGTIVWTIGADRVECDETCAGLFGRHISGFASDLAGLLRQVREESRDVLASALERSITERTIFEAEVEADQPNGARRTLRVRGAVIEDADQAPSRVVLGVRDATPLAASRAEVIAAHRDLGEHKAKHQRGIQTMEAAARERAELVAGLSREVRNRLGAVLGMSRLLLDGVLPAEQREQVATIEAAADELLAFTADTIDVTSDSAPAELELATISIHDLVARAVTAATSAARERSVTVRYQIGREVPPAVRTDPTRLTRALRYTLSEAVAEAPAGSEVSVTASATRLASTLHDLAFEVVDASSRVTDDGLARSVAGRLLERMGGRLAVTRTSTGTRAVLHVSVDETGGDSASPSALPPLDSMLAVAHPLRVLVAEDNAVNRKIIEAFLGRLGYRARYATNGREAVEQVQREAFELVFMDVQMPEMDGLEATEAIKRGGSSIGPIPRIVALTANALPSDRAACLRAGCDDYLAKPVTLEKLATALLATTPAPKAAIREAALDEKLLARLDLALGAKLLGEMLAAHEADARELVLALDAACAQRDAAAVSRLAATLSRSAEALGATTLDAAADELSMRASAGDLVDGPAAVERLMHELAQTRLALAPRLPAA